jgi:hypothetical protein
MFPKYQFLVPKILANDIAGDSFNDQEVLFKSIFSRLLSSTLTEGQKCGALTPQYDSLGYLYSPICNEIGILN